MKYILDLQTICYCTGILKYKKYEPLKICDAMRRGRQIFISIYSFIELFNKDFNNIQKKQILDFITENKLVILPTSFNETDILSNIQICLNCLGYSLKTTSYSFSKNAKLCTINNCLFLENTYKNKSETINYENIINIYINIENKIMKMFKLIQDSVNDYLLNKQIQNINKDNYIEIENKIIQNLTSKKSNEQSEKLKNIYSYLYYLNYIKNYENITFDKKNIFYSILTSYIPDFYTFSFDKYKLQFIKKYDEKIFNDLDSFIKRHP